MSNKKKNAVDPEVPENNTQAAEPAELEVAEVAPESAELEISETVSEIDAPNRVFVVNAKSGLRLRSGPGKNYDVRLILPDGATLVAVNIPDGIAVPGWMPVVVNDDLSGWVMTAHIKEL